MIYLVESVEFVAYLRSDVQKQHSGKMKMGELRNALMAAGSFAS
jgi:hypothetical protein